MGNVYRDGDRGSESEVKRSEARKISAKGIGERAVTLTAKVNFSFLYAPLYYIDRHKVPILADRLRTAVGIARRNGR